ncbi:MAG: GNAT family N-acetyltransferase [Dehalococcoidales bacterium]
MNTLSYTIKKLGTNDSVRSFSCGRSEWDKDINDFLIDDALNQQNQGFNVTWLCLKGTQIVGYTSLVSSTLKIEESSRWKEAFNIGEIKRDHIPCGLIAQFGIATDFQRQGIGNYLLSFIRGAAIASGFGIKLLTLHVHRGNEVGRLFWESMGFVIFKPASGDKYQFMIHDLFSG